MNGQKEDSGNAFFILVCLMIAVLFVLPAWYASRAGYINGTLLELAKTQIAAFAVFSDEAQQALGLMAQADRAFLGADDERPALQRQVDTLALCRGFGGAGGGSYFHGTDGWTYQTPEHGQLACA